MENKEKTLNEITEQLIRIDTSFTAHSFIIDMIDGNHNIEDIKNHCQMILDASVKQLKILQNMIVDMENTDGLTFNMIEK